MASGALPGLALSTSSVPEGGEVAVDLVIESILQGVSVSGTVRFPWEGECRRCLNPVSGVAEVEIREIFEANPVEGETWPLGNESIELEPVVREAVLLALPLAPLCGPDCLGPAPEQFPARPEDDPAAATGAVPVDPGESAAPPRDERWSALDELRFDE